MGNLFSITSGAVHANVNDAPSKQTLCGFIVDEVVNILEFVEVSNAYVTCKACRDAINDLQVIAESEHEQWARISDDLKRVAAAIYRTRPIADNAHERAIIRAIATEIASILWPDSHTTRDRFYNMALYGVDLSEG